MGDRSGNLLPSFQPCFSDRTLARAMLLNGAGCIPNVLKLCKCVRILMDMWNVEFDVSGPVCKCVSILMGMSNVRFDPSGPVCKCVRMLMDMSNVRFDGRLLFVSV